MKHPFSSYPIVLIPLSLFTYFRFFNVILLSGLESQKLWTIIIHYRLKYLIENVKTINTRDCSFVDTEGYVIQANDADAHRVMDSIEKELENLGSKHNNYEMEKIHLTD